MKDGYLFFSTTEIQQSTVPMLTASLPNIDIRESFDMEYLTRGIHSLRNKFITCRMQNCKDKFCLVSFCYVKLFSMQHWLDHVFLRKTR